MKKKEIETVWLEITSSCNLKCPYCYMDAHDKKNGYTIDQFLIILSFLKSECVNTVIFSGGEPCIHPLLSYFIECTAKANISIGVATNGTCISNDLFDCFRENGVFLQISIDAIRNIEFSKARGRDLVDIVTQNIKRATSYEIPIALSCTLSDINCDNIIEVCNFARENNIYTIHFGTLIPTDRCRKNKLSFSRYFEICSQLYEYQLQHYLDIRIDIIEEIVSLVSGIEHYPNNNSVYSCNAMAGKNLQFDCCGNVRQCGMIEPQYQFNFFSSDHIDSSKGQNASDIYNVIQKISATDIPICRTCRYISICRGGCRACAYQISGDVYGEMPYCHDIQRLIAKISEDYYHGRLDEYINYLKILHKVEGISDSRSVKKLGIY